jgi:hypothetical protein
MGEGIPLSDPTRKRGQDIALGAKKHATKFRGGHSRGRRVERAGNGGGAHADRLADVASGGARASEGAGG